MSLGNSALEDTAVFIQLLPGHALTVSQRGGLTCVGISIFGYSYNTLSCISTMEAT